MNRIVLTIAALMFLIAGGALATEVNNVDLSHVDGFTVARISFDGQAQFRHETVEAADGRPFRLIVDFFPATHNLGAHNFRRLPECVVDNIRTSQFSVTPEKVTRVVFDLKSEPIYRVESTKNSVSVYFADASGSKFASWSTMSVVKAMMAEAKSQPTKPEPMAKVESTKSTPTGPMPASGSAARVAALNDAAAKDRMASLAEKPKSKPAAKAQTKVAQKPVSKPAVKAQTKVAQKPVSKPAVKTQTKVAQKPVSKPAAKAQTKVAQKPVSKPAVKAQTKVAQKPVSKPAAKAQTKVAQKPVSKPAVKAQTKVAQKPIEEPKAVSKPTSRFRRAPITSKKIKSTLVAEFPVRLTIKYEPGRSRDPFASLVAEHGQFNDPIENRTPNIDGLHLVGVIESDDNKNSALFEDKDGFGYILQSGDKVQNGYVLRIESDRVHFQIFEYGWSRTVALKMED